MPTAPGGARWVGVALWKGAPTVPWGAGWETEKGTFQVLSCSTSFSASSLGRLQTLLILTTMSEKDSRPSTTSGGRHCMHGDGRGMSVGVGDEELFYSPPSGLPPAGGANGSAARGGTPQPKAGCRLKPGSQLTSKSMS